MVVEKSHPELKEGEVFIGNFTEESFEQSMYVMKRLGLQAYDTNGNEIEHMAYDYDDDTNLYPMFVNRNEYEEVWK